MVTHCPIEELSTELLLKIFDYLEIHDLCHLKQTCKRFSDVISSWDHTLLKVTPLVTNQKNALFKSRCMHQLSSLEKIRVSKNWILGKYFEKSLLFSKNKFIPWLHLNGQFIWMSRGKKICCYKRINSGINENKPYYILQGNSNEDIVNFRLKNGILVSGLRDGGVWLKDVNEKRTIVDLKNCHESDVNSVDLSNDGKTIVSGSRDNALKIWKLNDSLDYNLEEAHCHVLDDLIWKVSLSDEKQLLAVGTSGNEYINSIYVYDMERMSNPLELPSTGFGQGILDLRWDGLHSLWSCGYDSHLKRWDLRTGRSEQVYPDPHGCALYCMDYDYYNTIMTGSQMHGRVVLWDIRQSKFVQLYFMESCKSRRSQRSSPVYSLAFDAEFLYTATDQNLNALNFSVYEGVINDYSFCR
ncbi:hypothetical protein JTB14_000374 [Gonioctena quinquepunctata]|nr:hypothetical protein JTB14_000374 [Gonioctena quinquepunctata]